MFMVSYVGGSNNQDFKYGNLYRVQKVFLKNGNKLFLIEGKQNEVDSTVFIKLKQMGRYFLLDNREPKEGKSMRLVKNKNDINDIVTGKVKLIERSILPGVYTVYTEKAIYNVESIN